MTTALYPDLHGAARAAQRLRDRDTRRAGLALSSGWRRTAMDHLDAAAAADLEAAQLLREAEA